MNSNAKTETFHVLTYCKGSGAKIFYKKIVRGILGVQRLTGDHKASVRLRNHPEVKNAMSCYLTAEAIEKLIPALDYWHGASEGKAAGMKFDLYSDDYCASQSDDNYSPVR